MCIDVSVYVPSSSRAYRQRANRILLSLGFEKECMICGSNKQIHTHHIDRNALNNDPLNLIFLCKKCHINVHYGKLIFGED